MATDTKVSIERRVWGKKIILEHSQIITRYSWHSEIPVASSGAQPSAHDRGMQPTGTDWTAASLIEIKVKPRKATVLASWGGNRTKQVALACKQITPTK